MGTPIGGLQAQTGHPSLLGRDREFAEPAPRPASDSGVQAGMLPAGEVHGHGFDHPGCLTQP